MVNLDSKFARRFVSKKCMEMFDLLMGGCIIKLIVQVLIIRGARWCSLVYVNVKYIFK